MESERHLKLLLCWFYRWRKGHEPRNVGATAHWSRKGDALPRAFRRIKAHRHHYFSPWNPFHASDPWNFQRIVCFETLVWIFVTTVKGIYPIFPPLYRTAPTALRSVTWNVTHSWSRTPESTVHRTGGSWWPCSAGDDRWPQTCHRPSWTGESCLALKMLWKCTSVWCSLA